MNGKDIISRIDIELRKIILEHTGNPLKFAPVSYSFYNAAQKALEAYFKHYPRSQFKFFGLHHRILAKRLVSDPNLHGHMRFCDIIAITLEHFPSLFKDTLKESPEYFECFSVVEQIAFAQHDPSKLSELIDKMDKLNLSDLEILKEKRSMKLIEKILDQIKIRIVNQENLDKIASILFKLFSSNIKVAQSICLEPNFVDLLKIALDPYFFSLLAIKHPELEPLILEKIIDNDEAFRQNFLNNKERIAKGFTPINSQDLSKEQVFALKKLKHYLHLNKTSPGDRSKIIKDLKSVFKDPKQFSHLESLSAYFLSFVLPDLMLNELDSNAKFFDTLFQALSTHPQTLIPHMKFLYALEKKTTSLEQHSEETLHRQSIASTAYKQWLPIYQCKITRRLGAQLEHFQSPKDLKLQNGLK